MFLTLVRDGGWICIWNPSMYRNWKLLPDPKISSVGHAEVCWNAYFGVGYVAATNDYKLLIAHFSYDKKDYIIKMFSIRVNAWKNIKSSFGANEGIRTWNKISAAVVRERLHWFYCGIFDDADQILAFDLAKEDFEFMSLPRIRKEYDGFSLGVSAEGCLYVVQILELGMQEGGVAYGDDLLFVVWVMAQYGVAQSWTKLYRFSYSSPGLCCDLFVLKTCAVAALRVKEEEDAVDKWELIRIEYKDKEEQQFGLFRIVEGYYSILEYEESLLRV